MAGTAKPRAVGFNHLALEVGDIEEALAVYGGLFAFELRGKSDTMAFIDLGGCPDTIQRDGSGKGMSGSGLGIGGFGRLWRVGEVQAVARSAGDGLRPRAWASLSMLWARQTRPHSWATLSSPRIRT